MADAAAVLKAEDFFVIFFPIKNLFSNCPAEADDLTKLADFGVSEVHLSIKHEVNVSLCGLILFIDALAWFHFE